MDTWILSNEQREFVRQNLWTVHEEAISMCEEDGLQQTVYFLRRDLNFIKEVREVWLSEPLYFYLYLSIGCCILLLHVCVVSSPYSKY